MKASMQGKVVIVTGSNAGIGKQTAKKLYSFGATVVMACRDEKRANEAIRDIKEQTPDATGQLVFLPLDLGYLPTVTAFVDMFRKKFDKLDVLVNNAGLSAEATSRHGLAQLFQVNYLGHFLLTHLLLEKRPGDSPISFKEPLRVVSLSSVTHHMGGSNFRQASINGVKGPFVGSTYLDSKLYMNFLTFYLNKYFSPDFQTASTVKGLGTTHRPVVAVCVDPGAVDTDIFRDFKGIARVITNFLQSIVFLTPDEGSETSVYGATCPVSELLANRQHYVRTTDVGNTEAVMTGHPLVPYVVPYHVPFPFVAFESIGPFAGPKFSFSSIPCHVDKVVDELWAFSKELCTEKLKEEGVSVKL